MTERNRVRMEANMVIDMQDLAQLQPEQSKAILMGVAQCLAVGHAPLTPVTSDTTENETGDFSTLKALLQNFGACAVAMNIAEVGSPVFERTRAAYGLAHLAICAHVAALRAAPVTPASKGCPDGCMRIECECMDEIAGAAPVSPVPEAISAGDARIVVKTIRNFRAEMAARLAESEPGTAGATAQSIMLKYLDDMLDIIDAIPAVRAILDAPVSREPDGEDTKRLDWIEANRTGVVPVEGNIVAQGSWCIEPLDATNEDDVFIMPTLRETIDYAMRCGIPDSISETEA